MRPACPPHRTGWLEKHIPAAAAMAPPAPGGGKMEVPYEVPLLRLQ